MSKQDPFTDLHLPLINVFFLNALGTLHNIIEQSAFSSYVTVPHARRGSDVADFRAPDSFMHYRGSNEEAKTEFRHFSRPIEMFRILFLKK